MTNNRICSNDTASKDPGAIIAWDLPGLPEAHGLDWGIAYFPSTKDFLTYIADGGVADVEPEWHAYANLASQCEISAHFRAERWVRDNAMEVDPEGPDEWRIVPDDFYIRSADLDFLQESINAPQWVRDWTGPFTISIEITDPPAPSRHFQMQLRAMLSDHPRQSS